MVGSGDRIVCDALLCDASLLGWFAFGAGFFGGIGLVSSVWNGVLSSQTGVGLFGRCHAPSCFTCTDFGPFAHGRLRSIGSILVA